MTTYEHGRAPADAPVTWKNVGCPVHGTVYELNDTVHWSILSSEESANQACQWAHLAALADEVAEGVNEAMIFAAGGEDKVRECKAKDWLRRYRAAKGER